MSGMSAKGGRKLIFVIETPFVFWNAIAAA